MSEVKGRLQPNPPPVPIKMPAKVGAELEEKERKAATHLKKLSTSVISRWNALDQASKSARSSQRIVRGFAQNWKRQGHGCRKRSMRLQLDL